MIKLIRPIKELEYKALEYRKEHFDYGEKVIYGSELFDQIEEYDTWLEKITANSNPDTVSPDWVVTDTFFAIREEDDKIIGIIDLRHSLNEFLMNFGNCGYSVRPSERRKGYATMMLKKLLAVAKEAGMSCLHISVERSNPASIKTIVNNGGVLERSFEYQGEIADIYRISLL